MRIIRLLGSIALWIGALLGIAAGGIWIGGQLGLVQPMIVISGSMEPGIMTGDLLIGRPVSTAEVKEGDIVSLQSEATGKLVTHRVLSVAPLESEQAEQLGIDLAHGPRWEVHMQGDANDQPDLEAYYPGDSVLTPWIQIPRAGSIVSKTMEPAVALPILMALVALLGLSLLDEAPRKVVRRAIARVAHFHHPRVGQLDHELAAVGVDVGRLQRMDHLELTLYNLGVDVTPSAGHADATLSAVNADTDTATDSDAVESAPSDPAAPQRTGRPLTRLDGRRLHAQLTGSGTIAPDYELAEYPQIPDFVLAAIGVRPLGICNPADTARDDHHEPAVAADTNSSPTLDDHGGQELALSG